MNDLKPDKGPSDEEILLIIQKAFYAGFEAGRIDGAWRGINPTGTATVCKARFLECLEKQPMRSAIEIAGARKHHPLGQKTCNLTAMGTVTLAGQPLGRNRADALGRLREFSLIATFQNCPAMLCIQDLVGQLALENA